MGRAGDHPPGVVELAAERRLKAFELRKAGYSYPKIARALKCGVSTAHKDVHSVLDEIVAETHERAEELRALSAARLDTMLAGIWDNARKGHLGAVDRVLRIEERRAKLLGLDRPTLVAATRPDGTTILEGMSDAELRQRAAALLRRAEGAGILIDGTGEEAAPFLIESGGDDIESQAGALATDSV